MDQTREGAEAEYQRERKQSFSFETTKLNGVIYDVTKLNEAAELIPMQEMPTQHFSSVVAEGHHYWLDGDGKRLGPWDILHDWPAAQNNPAWSVHVATIKRANLERPIWVSADGDVFNGLHRLTRAFLG